MSALNKAALYCGALALAVGVAGSALPGCSASEAAAIGADLENLATKVVSDMLAGASYATLLADVGAGGAQLLVTVIEYAEGDTSVSAATHAAIVKAAPTYLALAKAYLSAHNVGR